jgi:hypothetical protein
MTAHFPHGPDVLSDTGLNLRRTGASPQQVLASLAMVSALLHLAMTGSMISDGGLILGGITAIMALACLGCGTRIWHNPTARSWTVLGLMNAAMLAVHLWLLLVEEHRGPQTVLDAGDRAAQAGHHHSAMLDSPLDHGALMWSLTIVSVIELTGAFIMLMRGRFKAGRRHDAPAPNNTA